MAAAAYPVKKIMWLLWLTCYAYVALASAGYACDDKPYKVYLGEREIMCYSSYRLDFRNSTANYLGVPVSPSFYTLFSIGSHPAIVRIQPPPGLIKDISKLVIRPLSLGIKSTWDGHELQIIIDKPQNLVIDAQGDGMYPLHIFVNRSVSEINKKSNDVIYFGPGMHDVGQIVLKSNQTLYLAEGAVVRPLPPRTNKQVVIRGETFSLGEPMIKVTDAHHVTIKGHGMITAERATHNRIKTQIITAVRTRGLKIEDILLTDANDWNIHINDSEDAIVDNVKILGYYINTDAICFNGSKNSIARNCFAHINDDGYEVKAMGESMCAENIRFEHCIIWNDFGTGMGVTHEVMGKIRGVSWKDITVIRYDPLVHSNWLLHRAPVFVHAVGGGMVSDLNFENITIEQAHSIQPMILIDNQKKLIATEEHFMMKKYNRIEHVKFKNITGLKVESPDIVIYDEGEDCIDKISFENILMNGEKLMPGDKRLKLKGGKIQTISIY